MANTVFNTFKKFSVGSSSGAFKKISLLTNTIKVALVTTGYVVDPDDNLFSDGTTSDAASYELNNTTGGYAGGIGGSTGRKTLASKTMTQDNTNNRAVFDATDVTWTSINAGTAGAAILLREGGAGTTTSDTGTTMICYIDSGFPIVTNSGDLTISWSTAGIIDLT
jgi:hypothetical protein